MLISSFLMAAADGAGKMQDSASVLKQKGDAFYQAGRFPEALEYYTGGLDKAEQEGNTQIYNACTGNIGNIYASIGDLQRSLYYFKLGYEASVKARDTDMQFRFVTNIVANYSMLNDVKNAKAFFRLMMQLPAKDKVMKQLYSLNNQAYISQAEGDYAMARYYHTKALEFAKDRKMAPVYVFSIYMEIGNVYMKTGEPQKAIENYRRAQEMTNGNVNDKQKAEVFEKLSDAFAKTGQQDSAAHYKLLYQETSDSIFNQNQFYIATNKLFSYENTANKRQIDSLTTRNNTQAVVIIVFVVLVVVLTILYLMLRLKNKRLTEAQKMLVSKNEELMKQAGQSKLLLEQYVNVVNGTQTPVAPPDSASDTAEPSPATSAMEESAATEEAREERNAVVLDEVQKNRLLNKINTVMSDIAVISRSDFSLNVLSQMVESNTKYVSWVINDVYGKNFRLFLSEYRIREACRRLSDYDHYGNMTLQAIYEELGYNSAASFIQAFKKVNGMTPSTYQRLMRNKSAKEEDSFAAEMA